MKTIIAAVFAVSTMTGFAMAQEAPVLIGNVSANVAARYNSPVKIDESGNYAIKSMPSNKKTGMNKRYPRLVTSDPSPFTGR